MRLRYFDRLRSLFVAIGLVGLVIPGLAVNVVSTSPTANAQRVAASADIIVKFDGTVSSALLISGNFRVHGAQSGAIAGTFTGGGTTDVVFNPTRNFQAGEVITVTLTTALGLSSGYTWQFLVASATVTPAFVTITPLSSTTSSIAYAVYPADLNNDGDVDVLSVAVNGSALWYENTGTPVLTAKSITSSSAISNPVSIQAADMDRDGDTDIVVAAGYDSKVVWFENNGAAVFTPHTLQSTERVRYIHLADMDSDGDMDVVAACEVGNKMLWYDNDGSQVFTPRTIDATVKMPNTVYAVDVDGDHDLDLVASSYDNSNFSDGKITWYENQRALGFAPHTISTEVKYAYAVYATDMDRDGDVDVISVSSSGGEMFLHENNGLQSFTTRKIITTGANAMSVFAADLDGDGDMDILSGTLSSKRIWWYENNGSQVFTQRTLASNVDGVMSFYAADVDGDGDLDVLSASLNDSKVAWFPNNQPPVIGGAVAGQAMTDYQTKAPFSTITVTDRDAGQQLQVSVELDVAAKGIFSSASLSASGFVADGSGTGKYTFKGTAAAAQAALRLLVFVPTSGRLSVGNNETVRFVITANDAISPATSNNTTTIVVSAVNPPANAAPSFTKGTDISVDEDAQAQEVTGWAKNISAGPTTESTQVLSFEVTNNNTSLFDVQPAINASTGTLTFAPAANAWGSATVTVVLKDNGGTANGGVDTSVPETFLITVNPVNDAPFADVAEDATIASGDLSTTVVLTGLSSGPNEDNQTLTLTASSNLPEILPNPTVIRNPDGTATILLTRAPHASGSVTVTITIRDDGGTARGGHDETVIVFTVVVEAEPLAPTVLFIPTFFSPNGDGNNDVFRVRASMVRDIRFCVYNANGQELFCTTDVQAATETGWDGRFHGRDMPTGTYTWTLQGSFTDGSPITFGSHPYGQVVLMR